MAVKKKEIINLDDDKMNVLIQSIDKLAENINDNSKHFDSKFDEYKKSDDDVIVTNGGNREISFKKREYNQMLYDDIKQLKKDVEDMAINITDMTEEFKKIKESDFCNFQKELLTIRSEITSNKELSIGALNKLEEITNSHINEISSKVDIIEEAMPEKMENKIAKFNFRGKLLLNFVYIILAVVGALYIIFSAFTKLKANNIL